MHRAIASDTITTAQRRCGESWHENSLAAAQYAVQQAFAQTEFRAKPLARNPVHDAAVHSAAITAVSNELPILDAGEQLSDHGLALGCGGDTTGAAAGGVIARGGTGTTTSPTGYAVGSAAGVVGTAGGVRMIVSARMTPR